ncbi:Similar to RDH12: Retinol dehydrogenase 12 (Bos taurus) [Cotesia congregata]|uniref:Similar to RDH12: Retinol dehydrogenase 12 (Bos taurus) n=1 Tax=Cotesia congregata TaxID=51543 RepID=A0A8J2E222_COTCN|nr:Similar to RDH12: Retinol dehydrogenase 12 (Bos taurus) [Cotesia congregata]
MKLISVIIVIILGSDFNLIKPGIGIFLNDYCDNWKIDGRIKLEGKVAVVTGATAGIGLETAKDLYERGATLIIPARNIPKAQQVSEEIKKTSNSSSKLIIYLLDLTDFSSVRACAEKITLDFPRIDILINNAGIVVREFKKSKDGFETLLQTNYLSPFLFTMLLLPSLSRSDHARVINLSSLLHYVGKINFEDLNLENEDFNVWAAYSQIINVLNIHVYTADPTIVRTKLFDDFFPAQIASLIDPLLKNTRQGAGTTIYCATSPQLANQTGLYYINCDTTAPSLYASNPSLAMKLWARTIELVGLPNDYLSTIFII